MTATHGAVSVPCDFMMTLLYRTCSTVGTFWLLSFASHATSAVEAPPDWAHDAIWYQIFPERFRNGDPSNDPTVESLAGTWPYFIPEGWRVSSWTGDWYQLQPWERDGSGFYVHAQLRRFGGDLQGVIDKLDYLQELGVNALYLNPVFHSASLHKYGATQYHHIDPYFGPDPEGDLRLFETETPEDPSTWRWSAADRLFLRLINEAHRRDMRLIIDGVFNHVGIPFWAFQQARLEGSASEFATWFKIERFDDPVTPEDEFTYHGWAGVQDLPELALDQGAPPSLETHLRAVVARWMDPNGDGDPEDGIDGWRLDVAAEVPLPFWRTFRKWAKEHNPDAFLTGEIWWDDYANHLYANARPWLDQAFDGVMNYRFGDAVYQFFNQPEPISVAEFADLLRGVEQDYGADRVGALMNLMGSHDTARIGSAVVNPWARQDHKANVADHPEFDVRAPNPSEMDRWRQMVAFQFIAPGAPYVYYGDEVGMWGADDPDCRKPMLWDDLQYDQEVAHPSGRIRPKDAVKPNEELYRYYSEWAQFRRESVALRRGAARWTILDEDRRILGLERSWGTERALAVFNCGRRDEEILPVSVGLDPQSEWVDLRGRDVSQSVKTLPASGFAIWTDGLTLTGDFSRILY